MRTMFAIAGAIAATAAPAAAQTSTTTVTRTTRPGVVVTTSQGGYAPAPYPVYAAPPQDGPYIPYEPLPSDAEVFGGLRLEVQAGFDRIGGDDQVLFDGDDGSKNGLTYGGEAGFDVPLGRTLLVGGYVGVEGSTVEDCFALIGSTNCATAPLSLTAGGRVGVTLGRDTLLYAKGGYTRGRVELESNRTTLPPTTVSLRQNLNGYHVGGGLERQFSRNAYGKIEYVYTRLRGFDFTTLPGPEDDFDRHQVKLGLGLRM